MAAELASAFIEATEAANRSSAFAFRTSRRDEIIQIE